MAWTRKKVISLWGKGGVRTAYVWRDHLETKILTGRRMIRILITESGF